VNALGLPRPLLHALFGSLIFVALLWIFAKIKYRWLYALLSVAIIAVANEIADAYDMVRWVGSINTVDTIQDIILTMMVPALVVAFRTVIQRRKSFSN